MINAASWYRVAGRVEKIGGRGRPANGGVEQSVARGAHNSEVGGSNPLPTTTNELADIGQRPSVKAII